MGDERVGGGVVGEGLVGDQYPRSPQLLEQGRREFSGAPGGLPL